MKGRPLASGADLQNGHDVRVSGEAAHGALLAQEAVEIVRVKVGVQYLDGNGAVERGLGAAVDDPEAAVSDLLDVVKSRLTQFRGNVRDSGPAVWQADRRRPSTVTILGPEALHLQFDRLVNTHHNADTCGRVTCPCRR